jgi:nucleoside 2-deoxyribosyltransferase
MKIYVASSWRNQYHEETVSRLREIGHEVYDYRNPESGIAGFSWNDVNIESNTWDANACRLALNHPASKHAYYRDREALVACDLCVLVLPSGRSASWEFGFACARFKPGIIFQPEAFEPELMYSGYPIAEDFNALIEETTKAVMRVRSIECGPFTEDNAFFKIDWVPSHLRVPETHVSRLVMLLSETLITPRGDTAGEREEIEIKAEVVEVNSARRALDSLWTRRPFLEIDGHTTVKRYTHWAEIPSTLQYNRGTR